MSYNLWKYFFEDDVECFRQYLARATYTHGASKATPAAGGSAAFKIGSPGAQATSPRTPKSKRNPIAAHASSAGRSAGVLLTRADVNAKDNFGRTILHHAATSVNVQAAEFVRGLLEIPLLDLYAQDAENGWTALHRALYVGNIEIAHLLLTKDVQNAMEFTGGTSHAHFGGLIKIKDHEGNSPFEVFGSTIAPRILPTGFIHATLDAADNDSVNSVDFGDEMNGGLRKVHASRPRIDIQGDEVFAFGSNKNLSLGLGDEDDRQFPERIQLQRPDHLLQRLHENYVADKHRKLAIDDTFLTNAGAGTDAEIPSVVRNQPLIIQDVVMSKMHTAVLTCDPISNLYVCGFGPGGRLGTGDEVTRFNYTPILGGGLAKRRVLAIALGHYHTVAICSSSEVFTWGSNKYGQLGYVLPDVPAGEVAMQLTPRQLYGLVKKEQIIGAAASAIHSVIYSAAALYTFGKNEGQLGLVDADARSLDIQVIPRRVGVSLLQAPIRSVSAIDRATTILLENHDVIVFTHFAWKRIIFPFEETPNLLFSQALKTRYHKEANAICKVTSGGNTICALSNFGQVFTVDVPREPDNVPSSVSTTNPNKARNALPQPSRVWSIGKAHMAAVDAAVGQDGSILLCTTSGSVWRKEKRAKIKSIHKNPDNYSRTKDYKFIRVPNLTRAIAVRSNAFGAFTAIRRDCDVTREQIIESPPAFWRDLFPLLSFRHFGEVTREADRVASEPRPRFWTSPLFGSSPSAIKEAIFTNRDAENDFLKDPNINKPLADSSYDIWITSTATDVRLPVHMFTVKARSRVLRSALEEFENSYFFSVPDVFSIEYGQDGHIQIQFQGADFLTIVNLVFYMYSDNLVDVWAPVQTSRALQNAPRYRQVRVELMKIASVLEMRHLERAVRLMVDPTRSMTSDFETAYLDLDFWSRADVIIDLANGAETPAHSALLCARCPFFEGLFNGRAGGMWASARKASSDDVNGPIRVDLQHIDEEVFLMVLRHIYADTGEDLFDDLYMEDADHFIDMIIDVTSAANELMLDRLAQICQKVLGRYVTIRNVCGLLNTTAECSVTTFKDAALEYICLNLEAMLEQRLLVELEDYLMEELDEVVRRNQLDHMPIVRSGRIEDDLLERHPQVAEDIQRDRLARVDSMRLPSRLVRDDEQSTPKRKMLGVDEDMPFLMDEDGHPLSPRLGSEGASPIVRPSTDSRRASNLALSMSLDSEPRLTAGSIDAELLSMPTSPYGAGLLPHETQQTGMAGSSKTAWKTSTPKESKIDFKQIMEQTTNSHVSNLTQAMRAASGTSSRPSSKMSQKERKKQQHEFRKHGTVVSKDEGQPAQPQSPWIKVQPVPQRTVTSPLAEAAVQTTSPSQMIPMRPGMTMRQTVSGVPPSPKNAPSQPVRTSSGPAARSTSTAASAISTSSPPPPSIQSIRHTPKPTRSSSYLDARTSMIDILSQQQGEKIAIKEAAAKRSLQEIQQEQEFQEWWDQESQRVQEQEARVSATAARQSKPGRNGRGGRGGRGARKSGADRDNPNSVTSAKADRPPISQNQPNPSVPTASMAREGSSGRGRGRGRRGRGKDRHESTI